MISSVDGRTYLQIEMEPTLCPSWKESAALITCLGVGILVIFGGTAAYFCWNQWIVAAAVGGAGVAIDVTAVAGFCLYLFISRRGKTQGSERLPDGSVSVSGTTPERVSKPKKVSVPSTLTRVKPSPGISLSREIYILEGAPRRYLKIASEAKSKLPSRRISHEPAVYQMSENISLCCIPRTEYYPTGREARAAAFPDDPNFAFLDTKLGEVVIQDEVTASLKLKGKGSAYKKKQAMNIDTCDLTWAHRVLLFNLIIGRGDCGISRFENSIVTADGKFFEIDNEFIGSDITYRLTRHIVEDNDKYLRSGTHWTLLNHHIASHPFTHEVKEEFLAITTDTLFRDVGDTLITPMIQNNIETNLIKVQRHLRNNLDVEGYGPKNLRYDLSEGKLT